MRGVGLIETMLWRRGEILFLDAHLDRLIQSAGEMGIPVPDREMLREELAEVDFPEDEECALRIEWSDDERLDVEPDSLPELTLERREGSRLVSLPPSYRSRHPQWKTNDRSACGRGLAYASTRGGNEGLFVDDDGRALEGAVSNVFLVESETVVRTAPADGSILPGIIRAEAIRRCQDSGIQVIEERFDAARLREMPSFLTSSLLMIAPVVAFNGSDVPQSPLVDWLRASFA